MIARFARRSRVECQSVESVMDLIENQSGGNALLSLIFLVSPIFLVL